jgi:hypothetical protein
VAGVYTFQLAWQTTRCSLGKWADMGNRITVKADCSWRLSGGNAGYCQGMYVVHSACHPQHAFCQHFARLVCVGSVWSLTLKGDIPSRSLLA